MEKKDSFKAIIVGGSVAGQTLALAFEKANIDYVLLERGPTFSPEVGASIGVFCNGMRVLDQLGLTEVIQERTEPLNEAYLRNSDGKPFFYTPVFKKMEIRHGYPGTFFERQNLLATMYEAQPNKNKLICNKQVSSVDQDENGVKVTTKDGSVYEGDIVIGADGVWSTVRQSMWRAMEKDTLSKSLAKDLAKDKNALSCEYSCIFGITYNFDRLNTGTSNIVYRPGSSFLIVTGKGGTVYWFYFEKLDKKYEVPNIPRYTAQDAIDSAEKQLDAKLTENVTFGDLWAGRSTAIKVALEEGVFRRWHYGRFVIVGDAAHKYTPNMGQGGNCAIESVATLVNGIYGQLQKKPEGLSVSDLDQVFETYQKDRHDRVNELFTRAGDMTRMEAMASFKHIVIGRCIYPMLSESLRLKLMSKMFMKAPSLDFVDKPSRPHTIKYTDEKSKKNIRSILSF